ncbi:bombyxin A-1 homolog [Plodia interpunctella]|uniref:bombyxin A-1 homolog n=1 Tax=Plodia interpunctella TaxID=58824 RepID=UPI00236791D3|nr:bombyxin A-1 homolog [Plodia interpunctella]
MKLQVILVLILVATLSKVSSKSTHQTYCGRRLANALAMLCPDEDMGKRSYNSIPDYEVDYWPWLSKARALEGIRGKRQGGVASECCDKPCSLPELLSYC